MFNINRRKKRICKIDKNAFDNNMQFISKIPNREIFGLGIGVTKQYHKKIITFIYCFIYPKQLEQSRVHCSIETKDFGIINSFLYDLRVKNNIQIPVYMGLWPHTHPGLGVFLSGTDKHNFSNWVNCGLENLLAIVFDPFSRTKKYEVFTSDYKTTKCELYSSKKDGWLKDFFMELQEKLPDEMIKYNSPLEAIITPYGVYEKTNSFIAETITTF